MNGDCENPEGRDGLQQASSEPSALPSDRANPKESAVAESARCSLLRKAFGFFWHHWDWSLIVAGIVLPFWIVHYTPAHFVQDGDVFIHWGECLWKSKDSLYDKDCSNYPPIGAIASSGVMGLLRFKYHITDNEVARHLFRYYLAVFDALQFLLMAALLRILGGRKPWRGAFLVAALPSSWAGSSVWGQLEGLTQSFMLLSLIGSGSALRGILRGRLGSSLSWLGLALAGCMLAFFTKQLSVFSLPWLLMGVAVCALQIVGRWKWRGLAAATAVSGLLLGAFIYLDRVFKVPAGFHGSSLMYVWLGGGSDHDKKISGNGFNIWMLLGRDMWSSSTERFATIEAWGRFVALTPIACGKVLFLLGSFVVLVLFVRNQGGWAWLRNPTRSFPLGANDRFLTTLLFAIGLENLVSTVVMAGTHERYLYHGYPFLLLACLRLWQKPRLVGWRPVVSVVLGAVSYGCFVFSFIGRLPELLFPFRRHEFMVSMHLVLFFFLLDVLWTLKRRGLRFGS